MLQAEQLTTLERKIEKFSTILEERPGDELTALALAEASFRRGLKLEALKAYQEVISHRPVPEAHLAVAEIYSDQSMFTEAYRELRQLFELDPNSVEARLLVAELSERHVPPEDLAEIMRQPTPDEAFTEAKLRLRIQKTIHTRELQERTRNVTLEPGTVIHEYYVEEAKKKLIGVDDQLKELAKLYEHNKVLRLPPRPEPVAPASPPQPSAVEAFAPTLVVTPDLPDLGPVEPGPVEAPAPVSGSGEVAAVPPAPEVTPALTALPESGEIPAPPSQESGEVAAVAVPGPDSDEVTAVAPAEPAPLGEPMGMGPAPPQSVPAGADSEPGSPPMSLLPMDPELPPVPENLVPEPLTPTVPDVAEPIGLSPIGEAPAPLGLSPLDMPPVPPSPGLEPLGTLEPSVPVPVAPPEPPAPLLPPEPGLDPLGTLEPLSAIAPPEPPAPMAPPEPPAPIAAPEPPAPVAVAPPEPPAPIAAPEPLSTMVPPEPPAPMAPPEPPAPVAPPEPPAPVAVAPPEPPAPIAPPEPPTTIAPLEPPAAIAPPEPPAAIAAPEPPAPVAPPEPPAPVAPPEPPAPVAVAPPEPPAPIAPPEPPAAIAPPEPPAAIAPPEPPAPIAPPEPPAPIAPPEPPAPIAPPEPPAPVAVAPPVPPAPVAPPEPPAPVAPPEPMGSGELEAVVGLSDARKAYYVSQAASLSALTATLARTRGVTSIFLVAREGTTIESVAKDAISEERIGELVQESFEFLEAFARDPSYWVLECAGGIFVMQKLDERHVLIAIGQAGANFGALRYTMDKTKAKFEQILSLTPA